MKFKNFIKKHSKLLGILIAALFLYLAFRNTDFKKVFHLISQANFYYFSLALASMFFLFFAKALRWYLMLKVLAPLKFSSVFSSLMMGHFAHNILPFRLGEFLRPYYLEKKEPISKTRVLGSIVGEKFLDGISLLLMALVLVPLTPNLEKSGFMKSIRILSYVIGSVGFIYLAYHIIPKSLSKLIKQSIFSLLKSRLYKKVMEFFRRFFHGISFLKSFKSIIYAIFTSLLMWLGDALSVYFLFKSFNIYELPHISNLLFASFIPVLIINIGIMIPSGPGDIGLFHFFGMLAFSTILGIEKNAASGITLLLNFITILPGFLLGGFFMVKSHSPIPLKEQVKEPKL